MKDVIEALLFIVGEEGLSSEQIATILEKEQMEVEFLLKQMSKEWKEQQRGLQIIQTAKIYKITTLPIHHIYIDKLAQSPNRSQLSRAAMETLAIIAYEQPITRLAIEEIRGVKSERIISTLKQRGLIKGVGRDPGVGSPILYGTTREFLEHLGLTSHEELPSLNSVYPTEEKEANRKHLYQRFGVIENADTSYSKLD